MSGPYRGTVTAQRVLLFLLRGLALYFLLFHAFLQFRGELDLIFLSVAFGLAVLLALWQERARLRFLPALLCAAALPVLVRILFFLVFRLAMRPAPEPSTDFLFLLFDKDFFPALLPYGIAWLFTFLYLRLPGFAFFEVGCNAVLLVLVFWTEAHYRLSLYPRLSLFALALGAFLAVEVLVLLLSWRLEQGTGRKGTLRALLSFAWLAAPLLLLFLLFLLGKYSEGAVQAGGGLVKPTMFRFDFSSYVKLESEIRMSEELVMLFRKEGDADQYLLRRFVLGGFDPRRGFFVDKGKDPDELPAVVPDGAEDFRDPGYSGRSPVTQEYFFLNFDPTSLVAVNYPIRVAPLKNWKSSSFLRVYRVVSKALSEGEGGAPAAAQEAARGRTAPKPDYGEPRMEKGLASYYTDYAGDLKVKELAESVTAGEASALGRTLAIRDYLKENYLYSLKPGIAADGNQLHHFLFDARKGYCSYFAFAMALMCRSLGIPARVAVGFFVDPQLEVLGFYEIRATQAHAWVEVYFDKAGWVEFDPTTENLAPDEEFSFPSGPDMERLAKLIREIIGNQDELEEEAPRPPAASDAASRIAAQAALVIRLLARVWYVTLPVLYLACLFCVKLLPSLPGLLSRRPRRRVKAWHRLTLVALYGRGWVRAAGESRLDYARRLDAAEGLSLTPWTGAYLAAVFSGAYDAAHLEAARAARDAFRASYNRRVALPRRVLAALSPVNALRRKR